ncbi:MAG: alpha/beta hydrolase [Pseudomonadota bacterium]
MPVDDNTKNSDAQPDDLSLKSSVRTIRARDGVELSVRVWTSAPPGQRGSQFFCLPTIERTGREFESFAAEVCRKCPATVIALDPRGRGRSSVGELGYAKDCDDLIDTLTGLGVDHAHFVASGYGGLVGMSMAASRPGSVLSLTLLDGAPAIDATGLARLQYFIRRHPSNPSREKALDRLSSHEAKQFPKARPLDFERMLDAGHVQEPQGDSSYRPDMSELYLKRLVTMDLSQGFAERWDLFEGFAGVPLLIIEPENSTITSGNTFRKMVETRRMARGATRHLKLPDQGSTPVLAGKLAQAVAEFCIGPAA